MNAFFTAQYYCLFPFLEDYLTFNSTVDDCMPMIIDNYLTHKPKVDTTTAKVSTIHVKIAIIITQLFDYLEIKVKK